MTLTCKRTRRARATRCRNAAITYSVSADGALTVTDGQGGTLLHEQEAWLD